MSENYWFTKVIPSCVACSGVVFGIVQYIQVAPLQSDLEKEQEKVKLQKSLVKTTKEYQDLQTLYLEEKVKREMRDEKLKGTARLEVEKTKLEIELESTEQRLAQLEEYSDYERLVEKLTAAEQSLSEYKSAYKSVFNKVNKLQEKLSLDDDLKELNEEKKHLETILDCMSQGCSDFYYAKYDDNYEPIAFEQYKHQLNETNRQISIIYSSLSKN